MEILVKVTQLLLSLSILVVIHEFGHYSFAKIFKTRVEKFYLFFDPWFSLFKFKKGETEYGIGWLPLGGYVKISGMIDESMDKEQMKQPPKPWEFRSKPAWQRLLIMLGGVLFNFILAMIIYASILFVWGSNFLPNENVVNGIVPDSTAYRIGFRKGDKVISVNDEKIMKFSKIMPNILLNTPAKVMVNRNGKTTEIIVTDKDIAEIIKNEAKTQLLSPRFLFIADQVVQNSNADKAGIKPNDQFIALNGNKTLFFDEYSSYFKSHKNTAINATILRGKDTININVAADSLGRIGIITNSMSQFELKHQSYNIIEAFPAGITIGINQIKDYLKQFKLIFNSETEAYKSVGSFITIGNLYPAIWDWQSFWSLTAFISIVLGVVNLLPIPALDGGHVVFVLWEMITGNKPSEKFLEYAQLVGFVLLILLMVFALRNDLVKYVF